MKPGTNHLTQKGRVTEFSWRYYERKVGTYLTLWTPLRAGPDGKTGFRTKLTWAPHGSWWFLRETHHLIGDTLRRERNWGRRDIVVFDLKPHHVETEWIKVGEDEEGNDVEVEQFVRVVSWESAWWRVERAMRNTDGGPFKTDRPSPELHELFKPILAGCAAQGNFMPLVDWLVENIPCIAYLFTEPGSL